MINITNFIRRSDLIIDCILKERRSRDDYTYWALYLDDQRKSPREVDTCATSICISILELNERQAKKNYQSNRDIIQGGINTLIRIRKTDGSWPSVVAPKNIIEGCSTGSSDVALIDSFFALSALLDVGFLSDDFGYKQLVDKSLLDITSRVNFFLYSIRWLLNNKAHNKGKGWYYTNTLQLENSIPTVLATANVLTLFSRILNALENLTEYKADESVLDELKQSINESIDFMLISVNADGGIGRFISNNKSYESSLLHTCRLVDLLIIRNSNDDIEELRNALFYITSLCSDENCESFRQRSADFYSEQYTLMLGADDEICIRHENCIEGILLATLISIVNMSYSSTSICSRIDVNYELLYHIIDKLIVVLEKTQTREDQFNGLFKCNVDRPEGMYPVYASYMGYQAIRMYSNIKVLSDLQNGKRKRETILTKCQSLMQTFEETIAKYGANDKNADEVLQLQIFVRDIANFLLELKKPCLLNRLEEINKNIEEMKKYYDAVIMGA